MGLWKFRRISTAEKLDIERDKTKQRKLRGIVPALLCWDYSSTADGYKYIEHELDGLNDQNKAEVLHKLQQEHGFIVMISDSHSHYIVVSEAVAAGREAVGWKRVTAAKTGLPLPAAPQRPHCQGE